MMKLLDPDPSDNYWLLALLLLTSTDDLDVLLYSECLKHFTKTMFTICGAYARGASGCNMAVESPTASSKIS